MLQRLTKLTNIGEWEKKVLSRGRYVQKRFGSLKSAAVCTFVESLHAPFHFVLPAAALWMQL
jgi:hypothetical protein